MPKAPIKKSKIEKVERTKNTSTLEKTQKSEPSKSLNSKIRTPVVAVMGHVDHGKTSFLDAVRGTRVADKEAGGITQNTRAHEVVLESGFKITFLDTPGHEAFSNMRLRGSQITDFILLIVAADDGVQPQTKESIEFAKQANVPIIVAINKIDIKGVNTQKIKSELSNFGVQVEEYGGEALAFEISAKERTGLKELLEGIQLLAEINELKPKLPSRDAVAEAFVLESIADKEVGSVALAILRSGNINSRLFGVTSDGVFKVRAYLDHNQKPINNVDESQPFWITGLKRTVNAGSVIYLFEEEEQAIKLHKELESEVQKLENELIKETTQNTEPEVLDTESIFAQMLIEQEEVKQGINQKELNVIVKASTEGTLEAILSKLKSIKNDEAKIRILSSGTGNVTEDDINRAKLAKAIVVTFQLPTSSKILTLSKSERVLVRNYEVIYELFTEVEDVLDSMGSPVEEEIEVASLKIKQIFTLSNGEVVLGGEVVRGNMVKGYKVKVIRGEEEIGRGKLHSIRIRKDEVREVKKGLECGLVLDTKIEGVQEGDEVVAYRVEVY